MNPIKGGDDYLTPLNMEQIDAAPRSRRAGHYEQIVTQSVGRAMRREISTLTSHSKRPAAWNDTLSEFYAGHAAHLAEALAIPEALALEYTRAASESLNISGPAGLGQWAIDGYKILFDLTTSAASTPGGADDI
jgi:hypothetical protein